MLSAQKSRVAVAVKCPRSFVNFLRNYLAGHGSTVAKSQPCCGDRYLLQENGADKSVQISNNHIPRADESLHMAAYHGTETKFYGEHALEVKTIFRPCAPGKDVVKSKGEDGRLTVVAKKVPTAEFNQIYDTVDMIDEAIKEVREALRIQPDSAEARKDLELLLQSRGGTVGR